MKRVKFPNLDELASNILGYIKSKTSRMDINKDDIKFCCSVYSTNTTHIESGIELS